VKSGPITLQFFARLRWLDGTPLLDHIEPYRRDLFGKRSTASMQTAARCSAWC
jgi:hypothetical protein